MSSTRTANDDSVFHQSRYASSPEFERGLAANLVARRCAVVTDTALRELIWFIHSLSHQPAGLAGLAADLNRDFSDRMGTPAMVQIGKRKDYNPEQVRIIRQQMCSETESHFNAQRRRLSEQAKRSRQLMGEDLPAPAEAQEPASSENEKLKTPAIGFLEKCIASASALDQDLCRLCLDPAFKAPWYFSDLVSVLYEYQQLWTQKKSKTVVTTLGRKVFGNLNYALSSRSLVLMEGNARLGKSFAAKAWCELHPGQSRLAEVPPGNDDASFYRALARGLGLGNFLNYKAVEIKQRVESVLLTGNLLLVLDEAHRLWPQRNLRYGFPSRIEWVMTMSNAGVPIAMVSTPQFIASQKAVEKTGWNSAQLTGRIGHYEFLPTELTDADLIAVASAVMPEASETVLKNLAIYARTSDRYLAAVDTIAKRAHYNAQLAGRERCTVEDVRTAMKESVIPSDTLLNRTLAQANPKIRSNRKPVPVSLEPASCEIHPALESQTTVRSVTPGAVQLLKI